MIRESHILGRDLVGRDKVWDIAPAVSISSYKLTLNGKIKAYVNFSGDNSSNNDAIAQEITNHLNRVGL